jgi:hypothetical protein
MVIGCGRHPTLRVPQLQFLISRAWIAVSLEQLCDALRMSVLASR